MEGVRAMNFNEFMQRRFEKPDYGAAPSELVAEYQAAIEQMGRLYEAGVPLTSEAMLELTKTVDELYNEIDRFLYPSEGSQE